MSHQLVLHPNPSGSGWQVAMQLLLGHHWALWPWLSSGCLESPGYCNWHRAAWGLLSCVARSGAWWEEAASAADPCARLPSRPLPQPCCWQDIWARAAGDAVPAALCWARMTQELTALPHGLCQPCPTAALLLSASAAAVAPVAPLAASQDVYLPPCPVLLLQLVSSPSWGPCQVWALLLSHTGGRALTCLDGDKEEHSNLPRCCRMYCPWACGGVRTAR